MNYREELHFYLALQGVDEAQIVDVVAEVAEQEASGVDPRDFFGPPEEYARQYGGGKPSRARSALFGVGVFGPAAVWFVLVVVAQRSWDFDPPLPGQLFLLLGTLASALTGLLVMFVVDVVRARRQARREARPAVAPRGAGPDDDARPGRG